MIVKGADFSQVKIRNIELDSKRFITSDNALLQMNGYISFSTKEWTPTSDVISKFWPISRDEFVVINGNITTETGSRMYCCTIENGTPIYQEYASFRVYINNKNIAKCPVDGYLVTITQDGPANIILPTDSYITNNESIIKEFLQISKLNPIFSYPGWCKSDGTWGSGAVTGFWPVVKDEIITFKTGQFTTIISLKEWGVRNVSGVVGDISDILANHTILIDDSIRVVIPANSEQVITMPDNGYLSIQMMDGDNDVMPTVEIEL